MSLGAIILSGHISPCIQSRQQWWCCASLETWVHASGFKGASPAEKCTVKDGSAVHDHQLVPQRHARKVDDLQAAESGCISAHEDLCWHRCVGCVGVTAHGRGCRDKPSLFLAIMPKFWYTQICKEVLMPAHADGGSRPDMAARPPSQSLWLSRSPLSICLQGPALPTSLTLAPKSTLCISAYIKMQTSDPCGTSVCDSFSACQS